MNSKTPLFDQPPPSDPEAELGVLGSIMLLPDVCDDVASILQPDDFNDDAHRKIYRHMLAMHEGGRKIDTTLLVDKLKTAGDYESIGGAAYLGKIMHAVPNAAHAVYYAEIVREKATLRRLIDAGTELIRQAYAGHESALDLVNATAAKLTALAVDGQPNESRLIGDVARDEVAEIRAAATAQTPRGVMCGLPKVDERLGPILPGELLVIAARPGGGKSAFAMQIAKHVAERRGTTKFISLEMRDCELVTRELCSLAGIDSRKVRAGRLSPEQLQRLDEAAEQLHGLQLSIWDPSKAYIREIRAAAKREKAENGLQLLVIDYLQLIRPASDERRLQRHEQVGIFTGELKALAKELQVPVVVLAQLNREADGEIPKLSHLRESGSIEQDADCVLFLHHPERTRGNGANDGEEREALLVVGKHRHGEVGNVVLTWVPQQTIFYCPGASNMASGYPKRPPFFALKAIRLMVKSCVANELTQDVFTLLTTIVTTEDCKRYAGPVTFHNAHLQGLVGFKKWERLDNARHKAMNAGWLHYEEPPHGSREPGKYWVIVPAEVAGIPDTPVDESGDVIAAAYHRGYSDGKTGRPCEAYPANGYSPTEQGYPANGDTRADSPTQTDTVGGTVADTVGGNFLPIPVPLPNTSPAPSGGDVVNVKAGERKSAIVKYTPEDKSLAEYMWGRLLERQPTRRPDGLKKWPDTIRLMRESDKRTHDQIRDMFDRAQRDTFWKDNILSPSSLRKQFDRLELKFGKFSPSPYRELAAPQDPVARRSCRPPPSMFAGEAERCEQTIT